MFAPATLSEYLGLPLDFGERVDLGGATSAGMVWRAAAAVELGICDAVLCVVPGSMILPRSARAGAAATPPGTAPRAASTARPRRSSRSPTATSGRTRRTRRSRSATPRSSATTRGPPPRSPSTSAPTPCAHPGAVFHGKPITVEDVLASPMIADPIHMLEIVMRVQGGAAVLVANADLARRSRNRPVLDHRLRRARRLQDPDVRRGPGAHPDRPAPRTGRSRWPGSSGPTSTWPRSTTATRSPC